MSLLNLLYFLLMFLDHYVCLVLCIALAFAFVTTTSYIYVATGPSNSHGRGLEFQKRDQDAPMQVTLAIPIPTNNFHGGSQSPEDGLTNLLPNNTLPISPAQGAPHDSPGNKCVGDNPIDNPMNGTCLTKMLVMAYYPDWIGDTFPPSKIDFKRFDWIDFAFAIPKADSTLAWDNPDTGPALLEQLVSSAHSQNSKVKLSIGGWTGSKYFSSVMANEKRRTAFVNNILVLYKKFHLDGIDIDWEYPGQAGSPGNKHSSKDTANFLSFLRKLRDTLPSDARITAAVEPTPFVDDKGNPLKDLTEFAKLLDWVLIMNYDIWGSSSNPGPNAPLFDACGNSTQPDASAVGAFNAWTRANFPASKLVLGLPSYGYISSSHIQRLRTRSSQKQDNSTTLKVVNDNGDSEGQIQFRELVQQGVLIPTTGAQYVSGEGFQNLWDPCSSTPFLRSSTSNQIVTYDSPTSLGMKAEFAKRVGMLGVNLFDIHGDTEQWDLVDSVRRSIGLL